MKLYFSELCLVGGGIEENVDSLIRNGAENIELMLDGAGWDGFHLKKAEIASMLNEKKTPSNEKLGYSVHAPLWSVNLTCENSQLREAVLASFRESIFFASMIGAGHVVLHPGILCDPHFNAGTARIRARESLLSLADFNSRYGQLLLIENVGNPSASIFTQPEFEGFLDGFPECVGFLVDIGHAFINGWDVEALIPTLGERLKALHIHDNDGKKDSHLPIGEGDIDWKGIFEAVRGTGKDLSLVLEYNMGTDLRKFAGGLKTLEALFPGN